MTERLKVNDIFQYGQTESLFSYVANHFGWMRSYANYLDIEYFYNVSGDKYASPLLVKLWNDVSPEALAETVGDVIYTLYKDNWNKQVATISAKYNPIENYSMTEQMTNDKSVTEYGRTHTRTDDLQHTKTGNEKDTPDITETTTPNLTNTVDNTAYGFNSTTGTPTTSDVQKSVGTSTNTQSGSNTRDYNTTDSDTGTQTDKDSGKDTHTRNYKLTRSGNIGVTTSQQMLQSERDLWMWNLFRDVIFPDVDRLLTLQIY